MSKYYTEEELKEIAKIIRSQIGGATLMACGARDFLYGDESNGNAFLMFRVGSGRKKLFIQTTLTFKDDYNVELIEMKDKGLTRTVTESVEGLYFDQIGEVIYKMVNK